jgi:hypothetical protein
MACGWSPAGENLEDNLKIDLELDMDPKYHQAGPLSSPGGHNLEFIVRLEFLRYQNKR